MKKIYFLLVVSIFLNCSGCENTPKSATKKTENVEQDDVTEVEKQIAYDIVHCLKHIKDGSKKYFGTLPDEFVFGVLSTKCLVFADVFELNDIYDVFKNNKESLKPQDFYKIVRRRTRNQQ